jgi:hypothetical protein
MDGWRPSLSSRCCSSTKRASSLLSVLSTKVAVSASSAAVSPTAAGAGTAGGGAATTSCCHSMGGAPGSAMPDATAPRKARRCFVFSASAQPQRSNFARRSFPAAAPMDAPADAPVLPPALAGVAPKQHVADIVNAVRARRRAGKQSPLQPVRACLHASLLPLSALPRRATRRCWTTRRRAWRRTTSACLDTRQHAHTHARTHAAPSALRALTQLSRSRAAPRSFLRQELPSAEVSGEALAKARSRHRSAPRAPATR